MPCYHPLTGYHSRTVNESGKRSIVFHAEHALLPIETQIPCGQCIGCRLDRSLQWATRCMHEASMHDNNCFITLTFDDKHLNEQNTLKVEDFQKFMKRLRKKIEPNKVRFFHCGEYGEKFSRPHHHACLFGYDFPDKELFKVSNGVKIYTSKILQELWPFGFSTIGDVTFESAAYVARYVLKKWSHEKGENLYESMKGLSNEEAKKKFYGEKKQEYITMSRSPGIGYSWYNQYKSDIHKHGFLVVNGRKVKPPKYYETLYELDNVFGLYLQKAERVKKALDKNLTPHKLNIKEQYKLNRITNLKRSFENDPSNLCNSRR